MQAQLRRGADSSGRKLIRQTWTRTSGEPEWTYESPILCADAAGLPAVLSRWDQLVKLPTRHAETHTMQAATTPFRIVSTPLSSNDGVRASTPLTALIAALGDVRSAHPTSTGALDVPAHKSLTASFFTPSIPVIRSQLRYAKGWNYCSTLLR